MRLTAWVCALLWAGPAAASAVLVVPETEAARELSGELFEPLRGAQLTVKLAGASAPAALCLKAKPPARSACLSEAGRGAGVEALLLVAATTRGSRATTTLTLIQTDGAKSLRREVVKGPRDRFGALATPACRRLAALVKALTPIEKGVETAAPPPAIKPAPAPEADRPTIAVLVPEPALVEPSSEVSAPAAAQTSLRVAAWTTSSLAVAAAGAAVTFTVLGLGPRATVTGATDGALPFSRAQELSAQANTQFSVALGVGIGAATLAVLSAVLWSQVK